MSKGEEPKVATMSEELVAGLEPDSPLELLIQLLREYSYQFSMSASDWVYAARRFSKSVGRVEDLLPPEVLDGQDTGLGMHVETLRMVLGNLDERDTPRVVAAEIMLAFAPQAVEKLEAHVETMPIETDSREEELEAECQRLENENSNLRSRANQSSGGRFRRLLQLVVGVLLVAAVAVAIAWAMARAVDATTEVSVELNVAELLAAVLGGTGVAAAGLAYAADKLREE